MYPLVLSIKRKHFCGRSWCIKINTFNMRFRFYYLKSNSLSLYKQNWGEVKNSLDNLKIEFLYIKFAVGIISDNDNIFIWDSIKYIYIYEIKKIFIKIKWLESFACFSVAESCPTLYNPMDFSTLGPLSFTISWSWLRKRFIRLVMLSDPLIFWYLLLHLP